MGDGKDSTTELIALARTFPLSGSVGMADYTGFFSNLSNEHRSSIPTICAGLLGQPRRKLALFLACIWALTQVEKQNSALIVRAAEAALEIMREEGINLDPRDLMSILQEYQASFMVVPGVMRAMNVGKDGYAWAAERLLVELVRL
jgi:hypothetical protein